MTKTCKTCLAEKAETDFHQSAHGGLMAVCKACHRDRCYRWAADNPQALKAIRDRGRVKFRTAHPERQQAQTRKAWRKSRDRKREYILQQKAAPCQDCGQKFPPECMDFDHLGDKRMNVATMAAQSYSLETLQKEIAKCELVCACCHRIRSRKRAERKALEETC